MSETFLVSPIKVLRQTERSRGLSINKEKLFAQEMANSSPKILLYFRVHLTGSPSHSHSGFFDPSTLLVKEPLFLDFELVLLYKKTL